MAENTPSSISDVINRDIYHLLDGRAVPFDTIDLKRKCASNSLFL
jgi:hypothetical protein